MIDFGSFTASDHLLIATGFCKRSNWWVWRSGVLKENCYLPFLASYQLGTDFKKLTLTIKTNDTNVFLF